MKYPFLLRVIAWYLGRFRGIGIFGIGVLHADLMTDNFLSTFIFLDPLLSHFVPHTHFSIIPLFLCLRDRQVFHMCVCLIRFKRFLSVQVTIFIFIEFVEEKRWEVGGSLIDQLYVCMYVCICGCASSSWCLSAFDFSSPLCRCILCFSINLIIRVARRQLWTLSYR